MGQNPFGLFQNNDPLILSPVCASTVNNQKNQDIEASPHAAPFHTYPPLPAEALIGFFMVQGAFAETAIPFNTETWTSANTSE